MKPARFVDKAVLAPRPRRFRLKTMNILYLAANRLSHEQIATMMKLPLKRVTSLLETLRAKEEVAKVAFKISGESVQKAYMRMVPETMQTKYDIMKDKSVKAATRLMAAESIEDRALGKPKQEVDINHKGSIAVLLQQIHAEKEKAAGNIIEADWQTVVDEEAQIIASTQDDSDMDGSVDGDTVDDPDKWIAENL